MASPCWVTQLQERGLAQSPSPMPAAPSPCTPGTQRPGGLQKPGPAGDDNIWAGEQPPPPPMQPFPPHQSPSQQPEQVILVVKHIFYCLTSCPKADLADSHMLPRGGESSTEPAQHSSRTQDWYLGLHSFFTQPQNNRPNAHLIKQSSQINVLDRNTQLQALLQPTRSLC